MSYKQYRSLVVFAILISNCAMSLAANVINNACQILSTSKEVKEILTHPSQIIVMKSLGGFKAMVTLCQRHQTLWKPVFTEFPAVIGKNGVASSGKKKEGDLKTPAGLYSIGYTFGAQPLALKMDYKYITKDDKFIDDATDKLYNTWVSGSSKAKSYESMLIKPYTYGAVVNYNMDPRVAGAGSAIFIHLWRSPHSPTAGCIALKKKHLLMILQWLDKAQHPYIFVHELRKKS